VAGKTPFSLGNDTYAGAGKLGDAKGTTKPFVVVFDEQHASRVGQVQIALMLSRLYHTANLRHLGLEGSVLEKPPNLAWFTSLPDAGTRQAVALQLLREGEVSAAEFAAMVLPGFQLHPIETAEQYNIGLSDKAENSYNAYLVTIALTTMTIDQQNHANTLLKQNKNEEAIKYVVDTNPWTSQRYQLLHRVRPVPTTDEMQKLGAELEAKAQEVSADVADYRKDFQDARTFFDTATRRSTTMAANTADVATQRMSDCAPIAMDIGAAHTTQVTSALGQENMSFAVVSPSSLASDSNDGSLSTEAYDRKVKSQSVDPAGALGAFLDGRHKPPMASQNPWFKDKARLIYDIVTISRTVAAAGGAGQPPNSLDQAKLGLGGSGPDRPGFSIDLSTIKVVQTADKKRYDVIFKITLQQNNNNVDLWIRAGTVGTQLSDFHPEDPEGYSKPLIRFDYRLTKT
jgi:hypothetical protein